MERLRLETAAGGAGCWVYHCSTDGACVVASSSVLQSLERNCGDMLRSAQWGATGMTKRGFLYEQQNIPYREPLYSH